MATKEQKVEQLQKILVSDVFRDKELYQNLLRYLVDASFNGITPKEITVAQEVFNKGTDFNPSDDASVRVHMHNLRNKLDQYYQSEGDSDSLKLYIPKGHYKVVFAQNEKFGQSINRNGKTVAIFALSLIAALLVAYIAIDKFLIPENTFCDITPKNNTVWSNFFDNDYPTRIVIGDFLIFHEWHEKLERNRRIMDYEINTAAELEDYIRNHPEVYPTAWNLGELPHNIIYNILDLQPLFQSFRKELEIRFSTAIDIDVLKNTNLIYIGEFKNLRVLWDLVRVLPIEIETLPWWHGTLTFQNADSIVSIQTSRDWEKSRYVTDLGILAMVPGQNAENYMICAGFGYNAQIKIIKMISHLESLRYLEEQMVQQSGRVPDYFIMAFEVKGFDRASTTAELVYYSAIDKDEYLSGLTPAE